ncbi:MAG: DUF485 domain-containing protein [Campylobacter sp.]|nr:DUF485 domain-containing protein [Campylobacter sp.]
MEDRVVEYIKNSSKYKKLVKTRDNFAWKLSVLMLFIYFGFIFTVAFFPGFLATKISGVITLGIPVGIFIIVISFVLTGFYTYRANGEFDDLTKELMDEIKEIL